MQAPITLFYDTHTVGEVLNKMARDTEIVDALVPEFMLQVRPSPSLSLFPFLEASLYCL